jgi:hypothetical protein
MPAATPTPTVTLTFEPGGKGGSIGDGGVPLTPTPTNTVTPTPSATRNPAASPTPTPSVTPSSLAYRTALIPNTIDLASRIVEQRLRVSFGFDGAVAASSGRRAIGWGCDNPSHTWESWLTLENSPGAYNPYAGGSGPGGTSLSPWSFKTWYQAGYRNFHFHNPFGKVRSGAGLAQELVYEVDQFLNARDGLTINGVVQNDPNTWLTNDFVAVFKALCTGQQGTLSNAQWSSLTAWFNPASPITLTVYIGGMCTPGTDTAYETYVTRWEQLAASDRAGTAALNRLKASVAPLLEIGCNIGFDAMVASPGTTPGYNVPFSQVNRKMQTVWITFFKWLERKIGKSKIYVESHPFRTQPGTSSPGSKNAYLGYHEIADADWYSSHCCSSDPAENPYGPHASSEKGTVEVWQALWAGSPQRTPLVYSIGNNTQQVEWEKYSFLYDIDPSALQIVASEQRPDYKELRLTPGSCCGSGHNYYWGHLYPEIIAYHLLDETAGLTRDDPAPESSAVKRCFMIPNTLMQVLPIASSGDPRYTQQFPLRCPTKADLVQFIARNLEQRAQDGGVTGGPQLTLE